MAYQNSIEKRIKQLEQKTTDHKSYICFVNPGEDRDEVLVRFKHERNVPNGARIHVIRWRSQGDQ